MMLCIYTHAMILLSLNCMYLSQEMRIQLILSQTITVKPASQKNDLSENQEVKAFCV